MIARIWKCLVGMPGLLRAITILGWLFGPIVIVASITPGWEHEDRGSVSVIEVWQSGVGPMVFVVGVAMMLIATLIYKGWPWVRHALMVVVLLMGVFGFFDPDYEDVPRALSLMMFLFITGFGIKYLYFNDKVVGCFSSDPKTEKDAVG